MLVAGPETLPPVSFALAVCEKDPTLTGIAGCGAGVGEALGTAPEPSIPFTVPAELSPGATLLVVGVACPGSAASPTSNVAGAFPDELACAGSQALRVSSDVRVAPELENENPVIDEIQLDGAPWLENPSVMPGQACSGGAGPELPADAAEHRVTVVLPGSSREQTNGGREHLELSWFATGGELDRPVSFVEAGDTRDPNEVSQKWTAPKEAPASGRSAELVFVLRDGRGGVAWQRRAACVVP
jgi:hypothetical protein